MNAQEVKNKLDAVLGEWVESLVDSFLRSNGEIDPAVGVYMKKGGRNLVARHKENIHKAVDNVMLFVGDEDGDVDVDTLLEDAVAIVKSAKPAEMSLGSVASVRVGGGCLLRVEIDNPVMSFLMGGTTAVNVTDADVKELASMMRR